MFKYNSKHKLIIGVLIMLWAAYSFSGKRSNDTFDNEGHLLQTGNFKEGKNHGKWTWFYQNGAKKLEGSFNMGSREGVWITYNKNGSKITESNYRNDKLNGKHTIWDDNGNLVEVINYLNDERLE
jgi:antitoxin component YwqK of YwqJK toxin-antitoxin module